MRGLEDGQQLCQCIDGPCYKECQEFQKLVELMDSGLEVYYHRPHKEDIRQAETVESAVNTSSDVFILNNKKDMKITSAELISALETKNISCPRCRKTFEHAQKLMQEVKSIDRKIVMGICDHCRKKAKTRTTAKTIKKPVCACDEIVKKFINVKGEQQEDIKKYVKIWLSKMGHLLKDDITLNKPKQIKTRAYSDLQINQGVNSPVSRHEPEIQHMFDSRTDINLNLEKTNLKQYRKKQAVAFSEPIEHVETTLSHTSPESEKINALIPTPLEDLDNTFVETYVKELPRTSLKDRKQEEVFEDGPSIDAKEALKRRHDLSLRQMLRHEKDSVDPYSVLKRPEIYETPKIAPWAQKEPTSKYNVESEMDMKIPTQKHDRDPRGTRDQDHVSNREIKFRSTGASQDSYYDLKKVDKYHHDKIKQGIYDSDEGPKKVEKLEDRYKADKALKSQRSVDNINHKAKAPEQQDVAKSKSWHKKAIKPKESVGLVLKPQYTFYFPKSMDKKKKPEKHVSSSDLAKDIRQQKLDHAQKKKLVQEEKKLAQEEKKLAAKEEKQLAQDKKYAEAQKRQQDKESKESGVAKKDKKSEQKLEAKEEKQLAQDKKYAEAQKRQQDKESKESGVVKKDKKSEQKLKAKEEKQLAQDKKYVEAQKRQQDKESKESGVAKKDKKSEQKLEAKEEKQLAQDKKYVEAQKRQQDKESKESGVAKKDKKSEQKLEAKEEKQLAQDKKYAEAQKRQQDKESKESGVVKKDKKSEPEKRDNIDEVLEKTKKDVKKKSEVIEKGDDEVKDEEKKILKEKSTKQSKDDDLISKALKNQQKIPGTRDKDDETTEKDKKGLKGKLESIEQKEKISESEKPKRKLRAKSEQIDKGEDLEKKKKTEQEVLDEKQKEQEYKNTLKEIQNLRKEKEAQKLQAKREELPKDIKSSKKKQDSSEDINVSLSKIQKQGLKEDNAYKQKISVIIKQGEKKETEGKQKDSKEGTQKDSKVKPSKEEAELKKIQDQHAKLKEEAKKKQRETEAKLAKALEEAERKRKTGDIKMCDINILKEVSEAGLILGLVRLKQAAKMKPSDIDAALINEHERCHHDPGYSRSRCPLCLNSELELDVLDLINLPKEIITDIIIGEKIYKIKRRFEKTKEPEVVPELYRQFFFVESNLPPKEIVQILPQETELVRKKILPKTDAKEIELEPGKGVLRYALSDRTFIDKGWTMLPTEKIVRKMNVYRMRPAHPEFDWFEHNKYKRLMTYDTGERLAEFDDNGRGRWYYRSGRLALDYYDAEETNAQQRFVIYSSGEPDERGRTHPITILATFDYLGNGIVFDHAGKIRLKYNQTEGVVLDRGIGPVSHWKWHTLNDPPVLQQVMIDTQMAHKDPTIIKLGPAADRRTRPDNEEMLAIEFDNFIKEKSKKLSQKFKPFQIKMKALKINEHFSLKVLDQATVYLIFRDGSTNLKLNIGMILDHQEIVDTDTAEVGEVSNSLERFPARTDSLAGLQRSVAHAQRYERQQVERERRLRPAEPCASADHLTAAVSPPLRLPLRTVPTGSSSSTGYCIRKPTTNLYYNTRLL